MPQSAGSERLQLHLPVDDKPKSARSHSENSDGQEGCLSCTAHGYQASHVPTGDPEIEKQRPRLDPGPLCHADKSKWRGVLSDFVKAVVRYSLKFAAASLVLTAAPASSVR